MERGLPVERVVTYLTDGLIRNRLLEEQDREIYEYGLGRLVGKTVSYTALLGLSLLIGTFVPGLWFLAFFFTLRGRTGGYHAATERGCFLGTMVVYQVVMKGFLPLLVRWQQAGVLCLVLSAAAVFAFAPVNHPNLNFDSEEMRWYKRRSHLVLAGEILAVGFLQLVGAPQEWICSAILGMTVCGFLLCLAKAAKQEIKTENGLRTEGREENE